MLSTLYEIKENTPKSVLDELGYSEYYNMHPWLMPVALTGFNLLAEVSINSEGMPVRAKELVKDCAINYKKIAKSNKSTSVQFQLGQLVEKGDVKAVSGIIKAAADYLDYIGKDFSHPATTLLSSLAELRGREKEFIQELVKLISELKPEKSKDDKLDLKKVNVVFENNVEALEVVGRFHTPESFQTLSQRLFTVDQEKADKEVSSGKRKIITDIFGNVGAEANDVWHNVNPYRGSWIKPYDRNKDRGELSSYGVNSLDAMKVTVESQRDLRAILSAYIGDNAKDKFCNISTASGKNYIDICCPLIPNNGEISEDSKKAPRFMFDCFEDINDKENSQKSQEEEFFKNGENVINALRADHKANPGCKYIMLSFSKAGNNAVVNRADLRIPFNILADKIELVCKANQEYRSRVIYERIGEFVKEHVYKDANVAIVARCLNRKWTRSCGISGKDSIKNYQDRVVFVNVSTNDIISALMHNDVLFAQKCINHFGQYSSFLLFDVATRAMRGDELYLKGYKLRKDVLFLPSVYSILLQMKGQSMLEQKEKTPCKIGETLAIANLIQIEYYKSKKSELPKKLVGEKHIHSFRKGANANNAWASFWGNKGNFFHTWATNNVARLSPQDAEKSKLPMYVNWFRKNVNNIKDSGMLPSRLSAQDVAEISIGYASV